MSEETTVTAECSKCEGVLDTTAYPRWCRKCRAEHKREYERTKKEMSETRGFAAGASAMQAALAARVSSLGNGKFSGLQLSRWIRSFKLDPAVKS